MEVIISGISRGTVKAYADGVVKNVWTSNEYIITFILDSNGTFMDIDIDIEYDGHMSFDIAKGIVEDRLGIARRRSAWKRSMNSQ